MPKHALTLAVVVGLALAACSSPGSTSTPSESESSDATFPVTVSADNGQITISKVPERIVSLSPTATEMLFDIGGGQPRHRGR